MGASDGDGRSPKFDKVSWRALMSRTTPWRGAAIFLSSIFIILGIVKTGLSANSDDLREMWIDGDRALRKHRKTDGVYISNAPLEITPAHLKLMHKGRFRWDFTESGAPMLDPEAPYGDRRLMAQLAAAFPGEKQTALAMRHVEIAIALGKLLANGVIEPGDYPIRNLPLNTLRKDMGRCGENGKLPDADIGLLADGRFHLTSEHIALARGMPMDWSNRYINEERLDWGQYPAATLDPKRPYGDMTWIDLDMAALLGIELPKNAETGRTEVPTDVEARLGRLHLQMLGAIQVIVENAKLEPGHYN